MTPTEALQIASLLRAYPLHASELDVQERPVGTGGRISGFHHWADSRACLGAFLVKRVPSDALWVLVIDWKSNQNYYVVLFPESRAGPIAELHETQGAGEELTLCWTYNPTKRDGKNEARRSYFAEAFRTTDVVISVPSRDEDTEGFLDELFSLAASRLKADELSLDRPSARECFPEGRLKERMHLARERNPELVRRAKAGTFERQGALTCACCGFDFAARYGRLGEGFIEAHHTVPVSELHPGGGETRLEDIALVCANCHRMLHRRRPWLRTGELVRLLDDASQETLAK